MAIVSRPTARAFVASLGPALASATRPLRVPPIPLEHLRKREEHLPWRMAGMTSVATCTQLKGMEHRLDGAKRSAMMRSSSNKGADIIVHGLCHVPARA